MKPNTFTAVVALSLLAGSLALSWIKSAGGALTNVPAGGPGGIDAPAPIAELLRGACYDCHSNETRWPWYSRVPPVAWLVARDVARGRRELNFSEWRTYYPRTRVRKLQWMERVVSEGAMPPWDYRLMHRQARLSDVERAALAHWIQSAIAETQRSEASAGAAPAGSSGSR